MRVVFLGTAGAGGVPGRAQNCVLVEAAGYRLLLDAGPGCGARLLEAGLDACSIDYVYISHLHLDHWAGLFDLAVQASAGGCRPPVVLVHDDLVEAASSMVPGLMPGSMREAFTPAALSRAEPLRGVLEPLESRHSVPCYGAVVRAEDAVLVYSSDTMLHEGLRAAVAASDAAIVEATMPPGMGDAARRTGHMTLDEALSLRSVMRSDAVLYLTHWSRQSLEQWRRAAAPRGVVEAIDHLSFTL